MPFWRKSLVIMMILCRVTENIWCFSPGQLNSELIFDSCAISCLYSKIKAAIKSKWFMWFLSDYCQQYRQANIIITTKPKPCPNLSKPFWRKSTSKNYHIESFIKLHQSSQLVTITEFESYLSKYHSYSRTTLISSGKVYNSHYPSHYLNCMFTLCVERSHLLVFCITAFTLSLFSCTIIMLYHFHHWQ